MGKNAFVTTSCQTGKLVMSVNVQDARGAINKSLKPSFIIEKNGWPLLSS